MRRTLILRSIVCMAGAMVVLTMAGVAFAHPFKAPPETNYPNGEWLTQFPYQRNVFLDFGVTPVGQAGNGIPGAVHEGTDDDVLKDSDYVKFEGAFQWFDGIPGQSRTGLIGIDNTGGSADADGTAIIHLDNRDDPSLIKHIWVEMVYGGAAGGGDIVLTAPGGFVTDSGWIGQTHIGDEGGISWFEATWWGAVLPNPPWEELQLTFYANADGVLLIDELHIATECVPEPATMALLGIGGLVLLRGRRRIGC